MNVVEIIVRAKDMTGEGFGKAEAKATGLGAALTKFAAAGAGALAIVGFESVKMASKFDASMEMLVTQAGVSQNKLAGLKAGVLALASQVGESPDSLAESLYHVASNMASLGATAPQMLNIVKVAAEGARTGGADLVDVTNALTAAVASGIPGVQNYQQAMGMLNATVGAGDMKMQDLAEAFGSGMVATVKGFGLSLKDVGAALATFGDNNIRGAHAGTQLRMSVMALASPTLYGKGLLLQWGEASDQLARDMRSGGLMKALEDLEVHFRKTGVGAKEQGEVITNMFGKKAGAGLNVLMDQLDRLRSKYPAITKGANDFGDAWQKTQQQTAQVFADLKGWFDALMISIGERLLPVVKSFGEWMLRNKTAVEITLAVLASLVGVVGAYVLAVKAAGIATEIWTVVQKALNLELDLNPVGLIIIAIAALVIGLVEAYKHSAEFRDIVHEAGVIAGDAFHWILHTAEEVFDWIKGHWRLLLAILLGPIGLAVDAITVHWHTIMHWAAETIDFIRSHWRLILEILLGPVGLAVVQIVDHWHTIMHWAAETVDFIRSVWKDVYGAMVGPVESAYNTIVGIINAIEARFGGVLSFFGLKSSATAGSIAGFGATAGGALGRQGLSGFGATAGGAATGGPRSGMTMVGEYGPELVRLPYGSQVYSSGQSAGMLGGGGYGSSGGTMQLELVGGGDDLLIRWLRNAIRIRGGNVQTVLGQGSF